MSAQQLHFRRHQFSQHTDVVTLRAGLTLRQMLDEAVGHVPLAPDVVVRVGGYEVLPALWDSVRPKLGTHVLAYRDNLHGNGARQVLGVVALAALAVWTGGAVGALGAGGSVFGLTGTSAYLAVAGVNLAGTLAVSALTKPPTPGDTSQGTDGTWYQLTGTENQANLWGVIPFVIGEDYIYPTLAANSYTETVGEANYITVMYDLGHGDLEVPEDQITIDGTPMLSYTDLQYEITREPKLYPGIVLEAEVGATLEHGNTTPVLRTSEPNSSSGSLDLIFPQGLFGVGTSGKTFSMWTAWRIRYRAVGETDWQDIPNPRRSGFVSPPVNPVVAGANQWVAATRKKPFGATLSWDYPEPGQYEVEVTRLNSLRGSASNQYMDTATWTVFRSIRPGTPSRTGTTKLVIRMKASDRSTGVLRKVRVLVRQRIRVYDRNTNTWSEPQVNLNPAWVSYWLLTECPAVSPHTSPAGIHLAGFADYADFCTLHSFEARGVCDTAQLRDDLIEDVLSCSLGSLGWRDDKRTIVFDPGNVEPSMSFSPAETTGFTMERSFGELPQAVRAQFINPSANWEQDEIIVLDDGYSYRGVDARGNPSTDPEPERFETFQLRYAADAIHVWKVVRCSMARGKWQRATYSWSTDKAGLGTARGDMVTAPNDVLDWGTGWGRVVSLEAGGAAAALLTLDETITTEASKSYRVYIRRGDRSVAMAQVKGAGGDSQVYALTSLPAGVRAGDMATLVEVTHELRRLQVTNIDSIRYTDDNDVSMTMRAVEFDARIEPFWQNPPESIPSEISGKVYRVPAVPIVYGIVSSTSHDDADDAGIIAASIRIGVQQPSGSRYAAAAFYDIRYRIPSEAQDWTTVRFPVNADLRIDNVVRGATYDISISAVAAGGESSDWLDFVLTVPSTNREGALALPTNVAGRAGVWDVDTVVDYSATDSSATIDVTAGTYVIEGRTIEYGAASVVVTGAPLAEKTYWLYYNDPEWEGGARTLQATDSYTTAIGGAGNVIIAPIAITFPDVGGSSGGSGGVGGGGTNPPSCPWVGAYVEEQTLGWITAGSVRYGHMLRLWDGAWGMVEGARNYWRPGYRIATARGIELDCSDTAPIRVPNGRINARDQRVGMELYSHDEEWDGVDTVAAVDFIGVIEVQQITMSNTSTGKFFRVGNAPGRTLDHHNLKQVQGLE